MTSINASKISHEIIAFHANCPDGFGAAYARRCAGGDRELEFHGCTYGKDNKHFFDALSSADPETTAVTIVDFSFDLETMTRICETFASVVWIDHHETAESLVPAVEAYGNATVVFDKNHSGATLAWDFYCSDRVLPALFSYVEDRDLWRFRLPESKKVSSALWHKMRGYAYDPKTENIEVVFARMDEVFAASVEDMIGVGTVLQENIDMECEKAEKKSFPLFIEVAPDVYKECVGVFASNYQSEIGNYLATKTDKVACLLSPATGVGGRMWSLSFRSVTGGEATAVDFAKALGGGGHVHAAGASVVWSRLVPEAAGGRGGFVVYRD